MLEQIYYDFINNNEDSLPKNTIETDIVSIDQANEYAAACEKQGFINGFRYAMKIAASCFNT